MEFKETNEIWEMVNSSLRFVSAIAFIVVVFWLVSPVGIIYAFLYALITASVVGAWAGYSQN